MIVTDEMVEAALAAYVKSRGTYEREVAADEEDIRAALRAAIALMRGQSDMVEFVAAVKSVRSSLARNRQFGDDTFGSWRRAACSAEGDLEEAIAALPAPPKDSADEQ